MVHNEAIFLPIWLRYYSRFFAADDIYVLDNDTTDGSTDGDGLRPHPGAATTGSTISGWSETMEGFSTSCSSATTSSWSPTSTRSSPRCPNGARSASTSTGFDEEFVNPLGYEILHLLGPRAGRYDPERPVLEQRGYWFANDAYDKPMLATVPMNWEPGLHKSDDGRQNYDPDLRLIHLHRMDYEVCRARHRDRAQPRAGTSATSTEDWAGHNRIAAARSSSAGSTRTAASRARGSTSCCEPIPESWRGLF